MGQPLFQVLAYAQKELAEAGIDEAKEEAERILEDTLQLDKHDLFLKRTEEVPVEAETKILTIVDERKKRKPLAYIFNKAYFRDEILTVNEGCLIPRPETEMLIEAAASFFEREEVFEFLDIGTGSGAIAISLLKWFKNASGTLTDISEKALAVAVENIEKQGIQKRAKIVQGDLFGPFSKKEKWDLIVSNPPYLSHQDLESAQKELLFEPREALEGGVDGYDFYKKIIPAAKGHLNRGGRLCLELGAGQAAVVSKWLEDEGYDNIQAFRDYSGIDRIVTAQYRR